MAFVIALVPGTRGGLGVVFLTRAVIEGKARMHGSRKRGIAGKKVIVDIHKTSFDVRIFGAVDHQICVRVSGMQVLRALSAVVLGGSIRGCQRHHRVDVVVETPFADLAGGGHPHPHRLGCVRRGRSNFLRERSKSNGSRMNVK